MMVCVNDEEEFDLINTNGITSVSCHSLRGCWGKWTMGSEGVSVYRYEHMPSPDHADGYKKAKLLYPEEYIQ